MSTKESSLEYLLDRGFGSERLAIVTSGSTCVPLDRCGVRFVDTFATGRRGSRIAEQGSHLPFLREIADLDGSFALIDALHIDNYGSISFVPPMQRADVVRRAIRDYRMYKDHLLVLKFKVMDEYRSTLEQICQALKHKTTTPLFFLAAAAADFEVPYDMLPDNKVSSDNDVNVTLVRVNKVREMLRKTFGDRTTVCCFKLETDHNVSFEKAKKLLEPPTLADAVVMNLLNGRYNTVVLLFPSGNSVTLESKNGDIDEGIVDALLQIHHRRLTGESVTPQ